MILLSVPISAELILSIEEDSIDGVNSIWWVMTRDQEGCEVLLGLDRCFVNRDEAITYFKQVMTQR